MIPKFRAWLPTLKWMCNVSAILFDEKSLDVYKMGDTERVTEMSVNQDEVILMQSTGLCDKRGVKIFEKDIVKFSIDNGFEYICDEIGFVYYCLGAYRILNGLDETLINTNAYLISDIDKIEVIGNIYENPELLDV